MRPVPAHTPMNLFSDVLESLRRGDLILSLAYLKIAARTRNAALGVFWNVVGFAFFVFGIAILWTVVFDLNKATFLPYVALGYFTFQMANLMMLDAARSISDGGNFALQNRIPLTLLPLVSVTKHCVIALFALPTVLLALALYPETLSPRALLAIPGLLVCILTFAGISISLSIVCVYVADLAELLSSVMRFMFFLTPVIWIAEERSALRPVLLANPLHHAINIVRGPVLGSAEVSLSFAIMAVWLVASWLIAAILYARLARGVMLRI